MDRVIFFHEFLAQLPGDTESFTALYPHPALVLEPYREDATLAVDTPSHPELRVAETDVLSPQAARELLGAGMKDMVHPQARLAWLIKTDRNPFGGLITLGRAANNDLIVNDAAVSKLHAIFSPPVQPGRGQLWMIEDRKSKNGTFLDGVRLPPEERRPLQDGTGIRFGEGVLARFFSADSFYGFCRLVRGG